MRCCGDGLHGYRARGLFGVDAVGLVRELFLASLLLELLLLGPHALGSQIAAPLASRSLHRHGVSSPVGDAVYDRSSTQAAVQAGCPHSQAWPSCEPSLA